MVFLNGFSEVPFLLLIQANTFFSGKVAWYFCKMRPPKVSLGKFKNLHDILAKVSETLFFLLIQIITRTIRSQCSILESRSANTFFFQRYFKKSTCVLLQVHLRMHFLQEDSKAVLCSCKSRLLLKPIVKFYFFRSSLSISFRLSFLVYLYSFNIVTMCVLVANFRQSQKVTLSGDSNKKAQQTMPHAKPLGLQIFT